MRIQIKHNQLWIALILAFFVLVFSNQDILAQKKKSTPRKRIQPIKVETQSQESKTVDNSNSPKSTTQDTESSATLEETIDFLNTAVPQFSNFAFLADDDWYYYSDTSKVSFSGCTFKYTFGWKRPDTEWGKKGVKPALYVIPLRDVSYEVPLGSLDPFSIKVSKHPDSKNNTYTLFLNTTNLKEAITLITTVIVVKNEKGQSVEPNDAEKGPFVRKTSSAPLYVKDEESANRLAKAFKYAAKLCGGKVAPF